MFGFSNAVTVNEEQTNSILFHPHRPGRAVWRMVAGLAVLFCVSAPFVPVSSHWLYIFGGIGYSTLLAIVAVGLSLLDEPLRSRFFVIILPCVSLCGLAAIGYSLFALHRGFKLHFAPVLAVLYCVLAVFVAFAAFGWRCYFTRSRKIERN